MPEWIWDPDKDLRNRQKHQLPLEAGTLALNDPMALSVPDDHPDGDRWRTIGSANGIVVLFVVHTEPTIQADGREVGRVISVRRAERQERQAYEGG